MIVFVQLMHPGPEPTISRAHPNCCPPNRGPTHKRKFLRTDVNGDYVDSSGTHQTGAFTFWGEWEPTSRVTLSMAPRRIGMPQYVHTPIWPSVGSTTPLPGPCSGAACLSTDPFVFCEPMLYFCCQIRKHGKLGKLKRGDIVAFGSHLSGQFVLDTLFVVAERVDWDDSKICPLFHAVNDLHKPPALTQVYLGATWGHPVIDANEVSMFSYFPAKPFNQSGPQFFARPILSRTGILSSLINPGRMQNFHSQTISNAGVVWDDIAKRVRTNGCVLGLVAR